MLDMHADRCPTHVLRVGEGVQVMAQIAGDGGRQLPWEDSAQRGELLPRLGALKRHTLALLERDPLRRLLMQAFVDACGRVLSSTTHRA